MRQKIDTKTIYTELQERLLEELDYVNEARNIGEFRRLLERRYGSACCRVSCPN